jgi:hypothetical protein
VLSGTLWRTDAVITSALAAVPSLTLGAFTLVDLIKAWGVVCAVSNVHVLVSTLLAKDPTDLSTSVNWPALVRPEEEWFEWFGAVGVRPEVIQALTFDPTEVASPVMWKNRNGAFFRLMKCTTSRPPWQAATGGTRHGQGYQGARGSA